MSAWKEKNLMAEESAILVWEDQFNCRILWKCCKKRNNYQFDCQKSKRIGTFCILFGRHLCGILCTWPNHLSLPSSIVATILGSPKKQLELEVFADPPTSGPVYWAKYLSSDLPYPNLQ